MTKISARSQCLRYDGTSRFAKITDGMLSSFLPDGISKEKFMSLQTLPCRWPNYVFMGELGNQNGDNFYPYLVKYRIRRQKAYPIGNQLNTGFNKSL